MLSHWGNMSVCLAASSSTSLGASVCMGDFAFHSVRSGDLRETSGLFYFGGRGGPCRTYGYIYLCTLYMHKQSAEFMSMLKPHLR